MLAALVALVPLADLSGTVHHLHQNDGGRVRVFVFLSPECPVSNGYTPTLNALHDRLKATRVDLFGVVSDRAIPRKRAREHFAEFEARFPVLFDASGLLAGELKPTHVPEAFALDAGGRLAYRGAIDDSWDRPGKRRPRVGKDYLGDALDALRAGKPVATPRTTPVGCPVETPPGPAPAVTYTRDIAPIVNARCVSCHRAGQIGPFALDTFEALAKRADFVAKVTAERTMPPWLPAPGHEKFLGERRLADAEVRLLAAWAESGRARGDADDLPPPPAFADGWRLGTPDLVLTMPEAFAVPADGPDVLQNFVIPIDIPGDRLVAAAEFRPGNPRVAHHAVLFLDATGAARRLDAATPGPGYPQFGGPGFAPTGALGGWSPGNTPRRLPDGMGRHLKRGSDLVVQMHYHPTGRPETDRSSVGLFFVPQSVAEALREPGKLVGSAWLSDYGLDIPAGAADYRRSAAYTLPRAVTLVGVVPHMHKLGKSMRVTATPPGGPARVLIDVPAWDFDWQDEYYFERPIRLPAGTRLEAAAAYDNSAANPDNPSSPPRRVRHGDGTRDEMLFCFFLMTADRAEDLVAVILDNLADDARKPR